MAERSNAQRIAMHIVHCTLSAIYITIDTLVSCHLAHRECAHFVHPALGPRFRLVCGWLAW